MDKIYIFVTSDKIVRYSTLITVVERSKFHFSVKLVAKLSLNWQ